MISEGAGIPTCAANEFKFPPGTVHCWWNSREGVLKSDDSDLTRQC